MLLNMNSAYPIPAVGIVGAGQLARMTIQAAIQLAVPTVLLADHAGDSAALVSLNVRIGSASDFEALDNLAKRCQVMTFDHELVPFEHLERLEAQGRTLYPSAETMSLAQNKRLQREQFASAGLPVPPFAMIANPGALIDFGRSHGWPTVLKAARGGYDGRGVWIVADEDSGSRLVDSLLEPLFPVGKGIRLLGVTLSSLGEGSPDAGDQLRLQI